MPITTSYTLSEAQEMLGLWKECERQLASGQAQSYRIGTREFTSINLPEIANRINYFGNVVDALTKGARTKRVQRVIPRDL